MKGKDRQLGIEYKTFDRYITFYIRSYMKYMTE